MRAASLPSRSAIRKRRQGGFALALLMLASQLSATAAIGAAPPPTAEQQALQADWGRNGTWEVVRLGFSGFLSEEEYLDPKVPERFPPPLNAEARRLRETIRQELSRGKARYNPTADCMPAGVPYLLAHPTGFEIQFSANRAMMLYGSKEYRLIYTDGRGHPDPAEFDPGFYGHSIGRWDGRTFVVDTVGLRGGDKMQVEPHIPFTNAMHVTERWTQVGPDELKVEVTMDDPGIMTRPWIVTQTMLRRPNTELEEAICVENNRNPTGKDGGPLILGPDGKPIPQ
jgi:hypothetical protein